MLRSVIIICVLAVTDCARILAVFPTPSLSYQVVFRPLTQELARRGHEVVVTTTDPAFPKENAPENLTEIDLHNLSYTIWRDFLATNKGNKKDLTMILELSLNLLKVILMKQMATHEVQKLIRSKNETFDLLFLEAIVRPNLLFTHLFKASTIQISSLGFFFGNSFVDHAKFFGNPLWTTQIFNNLTLWEKISELYSYYSLSSMYKSLEEAENKAIIHSFGDDVPPLNDLQKIVDMLFLNVHPIWDSNRPVPPSVVRVFMGGVHQNPNKDLPKLSPQRGEVPLSNVRPERETLDRVVWWTEHVLRHCGAGHLRSPTANMPWAEFLQLDVVLVLLAGAVAGISFAGAVLYFVYVKVLGTTLRLRMVKEN